MRRRPRMQRTRATQEGGQVSKPCAKGEQKSVRGATVLGRARAHAGGGLRTTVRFVDGHVRLVVLRLHILLLLVGRALLAGLVGGVL